MTNRDSEPVRVIKRLSAGEREVLRARFGVELADGASWADVQQQFDISEECIRGLEQRERLASMSSLEVVIRVLLRNVALWSVILGILVLTLAALNKSIGMSLVMTGVVVLGSVVWWATRRRHA
jgi:hypothetical protein